MYEAMAELSPLFCGLLRERNSTTSFTKLFLHCSAHKMVLRWGESTHQQNSPAVGRCGEAINASTITLVRGRGADSGYLKPSRTWDSEEKRREPSRGMSAVGGVPRPSSVSQAPPSVTTFKIRSSLASSVPAGAQHCHSKIWYLRTPVNNFE